MFPYFVENKIQSAFNINKSRRGYSNGKTFVEYVSDILLHHPFHHRQNDSEDSELSIQLDVFDEQKLVDDEELMSYYPDDGVDLNSPVECFHAIFKKV